MEVLFDPQSRTTDKYDVIEIFSGEGPSKTKIGHFCEQQWHGQKEPIRVAASSVTISFRARSQKPPSWGYRLKVSFNEVALIKLKIVIQICTASIRTPFSWVHDLARCIAALCGNLAAILLDGFETSEDEVCTLEVFPQAFLNYPTACK